MPNIDEVIIEETPYVMEETRYQAIKEFMNGRDISSSYSDPTHNSQYDFQEFVYVYEEEKRQADLLANPPEEDLPIIE
jgi:hypothetical protein